MSSRSPVFAQLLAGLYPTEFARCAADFPGLRAPRGPTPYEHFLALCLHQLTRRESSLRDLVATLQARASRCYHLGLRGPLMRIGLAYAHTHRDWRLFAAVAQVLMRRAQRLQPTTAPETGLPELAFALDSSMIELSLALFP